MDDQFDDAMERAIEAIKQAEHAKREKHYRGWCEELAALPDNCRRRLPKGFRAGVELQPYRWIQQGLDLIGSRKSAGKIGGKEDVDFRAYLPYSVFQAGSEIFLKGMWLYQHDDCRQLKHDSYISSERRKYYFDLLLNLSKSHDLLKIIRKVEAIATYKNDAWLSRFLKVLNGCSRFYYYPAADSKQRWADERYPKRFYDDRSKTGKADAYKSFPDHWLVSRLFEEAAVRIDNIWR